jgi:hypothetical protein
VNLFDVGLFVKPVEKGFQAALFFVRRDDDGLEAIEVGDILMEAEVTQFDSSANFDP